MFILFTLSEATPSIIMIAIAIITLFLNIIVAKRSNERFKQKEMKSKADIIYVDKEIKNSEKNTDLKLKLLLQSNEETKATIEAMSKQVNYIYKRHYKP